MLQAIHIHKHFANRTLFQDLSWQLQKGDRVGMVGPNGAGKTTLMRMLAGEETADDGSISCSRDHTIGYLPQEIPRLHTGSVLERVLSGAKSLQALQHAIEAVEKDLQTASENQVQHLIQKHAELLDRYALEDGPSLQGRACRILNGLGFQNEAMHQPLTNLSGGWWMRVELARLLLSKPDYLLLDEPTNHLDFTSLQWLENFLENYPGGWISVSHDRYFLNRQVSSIVELSSSGLLVFPGNYDAYLQAKEALQAQQAQQQRVDAKRLEDLQGFIDRFRAKASKARQVQSRIKQLDRIPGPPAALTPTSSLSFALPQPPRAGAWVARLEGVCKSYGSRTIYQDFHFQINRGDKIALVGPNGAGKTTLLKLLAGNLQPDKGACQRGYNVQPFYFAQHQLEILNARHTILEEMQQHLPADPITQIRTLLGVFLFTKDTVHQKIGILSGGEKSRLALAKMLAQPANFLLMDEPTNHLDLASRHMLESALIHYTGTLVFISHDRYFINHIAHKVVEIQPGGQVETFEGNYDCYLWKKQSDAKTPPALYPTDLATELASAVGVSPQKSMKKKAPQAPIYPERKAARRLQAQRAKEVAALEEAITQAESRIQAIDACMSHPRTYKDGQACKTFSDERSALTASLTDLYNRWQQLSDG